MTSNPFAPRPAIEADFPFIVDSWVISYRWHPSSHQYSVKRYIHEQKWMVNELLRRCDVTVACKADDPETIVGYVVSSRFGIHYVLTKKSPDFTRLGIATMLLAPWIGREDVVYGSRPMANLPIPKGWEYCPMIHARVLAEPLRQERQRV